MRATRIATLHASDCALHNGPALLLGECNCGAGDLPKVVRKIRRALEAQPPHEVKLTRHNARIVLDALEAAERLGIDINADRVEQPPRDN